MHEISEEPDESKHIVMTFTIFFCRQMIFSIYRILTSFFSLYIQFGVNFCLQKDMQ